MIYADSSFLLRLLSNEAGSAEAVAIFRKLGRPAMAFSPLHEVEVRNALRAKAFVEKQSLSPSKRTSVDRDLANWEARLERFLTRGTFATTDVDWSTAIARALRLSAKHTLQLGTRAYDILHVAFALELHCRIFVTCDIRQAALAKSAGLKVTLAEVGD